jgi:hypothetical protein
MTSAAALAMAPAPQHPTHQKLTPNPPHNSVILFETESLSTQSDYLFSNHFAASPKGPASLKFPN